MKTLVKIGTRKSIDPFNIITLKADLNYTSVHFLDGKKDEIISYTLKRFEDKLLNHPFFFRINRSVIINLNYIKNVSNGTVELKNGEFFNASKRRKKAFLKILNLEA
ncbi:MAG: LytR/AlgR family response regulator transcription factor [Leadbetterella sp.]